MCFPRSCLFTLCVAGENQGIIHDPPPSAPCREGEAGNIPVKCQMFGRALRAADGFGGETGNSSGAGRLEVQKFAEWKTSGFRKVGADEMESSQTHLGSSLSVAPSWLCGPWQITSSTWASISSAHVPFRALRFKDAIEAVYELHFEG